MKKIIIIILFLGVGPSINGGSQWLKIESGEVPLLLENITPYKPSGELEVVNLSNNTMWLENQ